MAYVVVGVMIAMLALGVWLWWTGARRDLPPAARASVREPDHEREMRYDPRAGATLLLEDNLWDDCVVDGIKEDWRRFAADGARGFSGVPAGRHRIATACARGAAVLDCVLYPGEVLAARLDVASAEWRAAEGARAARRGGGRGLVSYTTVLGVARASRGERVRAPDDAVRAVIDRARRLFERAAQGAPAEPLLAEALAVGRALLVGVPLTRAHLAALVAEIGGVVEAESALGAHKRGALAASIGLALLPGDPHLLEQLARALLAAGVADEALARADEALERAAVLDEAPLARARATKAEALAALGRVDEARAIVDALASARPDDPVAARARRAVYDRVSN